MITLVVAVGLVAALYLYLTRTFGYWQKRGVRHDAPWPLFGTNAKNYLLQMSMSDIAKDTYRRYPGERVVGFFRSTSPELVIRDPAIAKRILTEDFSYFHRRAMLHPNFKFETLQKHQFAVDDDLWRLTRIRMTPAFSSGKLKAMFPLILERAERLQNRLHKIVSQKEAIDARDLMARFTTDVIGTIGFGVVSDSLNDQNTAFRELGTKALTDNFSRTAKMVLKNLLPRLFDHLKILTEIEKEIVEMMQTVMRQRNYQPCGRNDFIDLLMECKNKGAMTGESIVKVNADGSPKIVSIDMDDGVMAAQCFLFFVAGFETSSAATSGTLHQLAHHPRAQRKVQEEIDRVLAKHDNKLSYDAIMEMTYLRWCLDEALRMFPSVGFLKRQCVRPYKISDMQLTIERGVGVTIPIDAYQNDTEIFPEPKDFRPERFDPAVLTAQQKVAYMPFGEGPRACIGERLGLMQSLAGLAAVLAQFSVTPAPGAPLEFAISPRSSVIQLVMGGLPLIFRERTHHD